MKCKKFTGEIVDYYYDELSPEEKTAIDTHLAKCADCRKLLDDLRATSRALHAWKMPEQGVNFIFAQDKSTFFDRIKDLLPSFALLRRRPAITFFGAVAVAFLLLSFGNFRIMYNADTGTIVAATSVFGIPEEQFNYVLVIEQLGAVQKRNLEIMNRMLAEYEKYQRDQMYNLAMNISQDWQNQREMDLAIFGSSLRSISESTGEELNNTLALVLDLLETTEAQTTGVRQIKK